MARLVEFKQFVKDNNLEILTRASHEFSLKEIDLKILGLELMGNILNKYSLILIGKRELEAIDLAYKNNGFEAFRAFLLAKPLALIISDDLELPAYLLEIFSKANVWVLRSGLDLSFLYYKLYSYLKEKIEPRLSVHATFLNIHGMGVLLMGESGIGKSETALDLIKRGHELISDDIVELYEGTSGYLIGEAPDVSKHMLEIRGIGIVDVIHMFGASSYYPRKKVDLVIELKRGNEDWDRLGLNDEYVKFLRNEVKKMVIPVLPGRNIALLVESATLKAKLKKYMDIDDSKSFVDKLDKRRRID